VVAYKYYELSCGKLAESASIITGRPILGISAANPKSFVVRASSMPDFTEANLVFRKQIKLLNCDRIFAVKLLSEGQIGDQFSNDDIEKMPVYDKCYAEYFGQN
jgi:hypothetical protein